MVTRKMFGAIVGDICGSIYEWNNRKTDNPSEIELMSLMCCFTDDTVLTLAIADAAQRRRCENDDDSAVATYQKKLHRWANKYPYVGYGPSFAKWAESKKPEPYNSWGNGAAMRVSSIAWLFDDEAKVLKEAAFSAMPTHNHPEGIKGAQATALAVFLARSGHAADIKKRIEAEFDYDLSKSLAEIRPTYEFDVSCQGTVPVAIRAFLESHDFVSAIQNAISVGGDSDTIAAITGSIAEAAYHGVPEPLLRFAVSKLPQELLMVLLPHWTEQCTLMRFEAANED